MQDLREAFRALAVNPLISAVAIVSLALGIGANTAIFSILNSLLLKPLPVDEPDRLVAIGAERPGEDAALTYPVWRQVRDQKLLDNPFVWAPDRTILRNGAEALPLETVWASGTFFEVLGVNAVVGRTFGPDDDQRDGGRHGPVAVVSHGFAQRRFGAAALAVGQRLTIERVSFTIVGVTHPAFFGLNVGSAFDVILPLETEGLLGRRPVRLDSAFWPWLHISSRLGPGNTIETMAAALRAAQPRIRETTMPDYVRAEDRDAYLRTPWTLRPAGTGSSPLRGRYSQALITLLAIVAVVLLVACANIASLQLARTGARRYQFALRSALGASRFRIARGLFVESLVLAGIGAGLGFVFAHWASRLVVSQLSTWASTAYLDLSPDMRVLAVTGAVTIATTALFGTVPMLRGARVEPIEILRRGNRALPGGGAFTPGGWLVPGQVALSMLLVIGAALFMRSFASLAYRDLGFDRARLLVAVVDARQTAAAPGQRIALYDRLRGALSAVPGVQSAAASMATPLGNAGVRFTPEVEARDGSAARRAPVRILTNPVSPDWFRTFGTPLIEGRDFDERDRATSASVGIVNEAFARRYFEAGRAVGQTLIVGSTTAVDSRRPVAIVGVVRDAAFTSVREPVEPVLYRPLAQGVEEQQLASIASISLSVRAADGISPAALTNSLTAAISGVDPHLSVSYRTVTEQLSAHYVRERLLALSSGFFGGLALLLAAVGLYGVTAHSVGRRRAEIGIRMALGAGRRAIAGLVLGRVAVMTGAGIAAGVLASLWIGPLLEPLLFNTPGRDPVTLALCALLLAAVAGIAAWLPARRTMRIDPAAALREG